MLACNTRAPIHFVFSILLSTLLPNFSKSGSDLADLAWLSLSFVVFGFFFLSKGTPLPGKRDEDEDEDSGVYWLKEIIPRCPRGIVRYIVKNEKSEKKGDFIQRRSNENENEK